MLEFLNSSATNRSILNPLEAPHLVDPLDLLIRIVLATVFGAIVAWIYRQTRKQSGIIPSFPITLVLLAGLIAMVTQVIGDNIARAFSLVGALSIVRFRTVVRDTQDTAYVIFAVVVGMAVGAANLWVAILGIVVIGFASFLMMGRSKTSAEGQQLFLLSVRIGLGHDLEKMVGAILDQHLRDRELVSIATAKQGVALDVTYQCRIKSDGSADELVKALNRVEGVQSVELEREDFDAD